MCVHLLTLSSLLSSHPIFLLLEGLWIFFTVFSSCYFLLSYCLPIFYVLRSSPSASLSLLLSLSLSFNLSSLRHFAIHSPGATGSLLRILLSPNSISTLPPISLQCRTSRLVTSYCLCFYPSPFHALFFHCVIALCVCAHAYVMVYPCESFSASSCLLCPRPCPSLPSVTGETAFWLPGISVQIKSRR